MNESIKTITLSLQGGRVTPVVKVKKYDTARVLQIRLTDGGEPYSIDPSWLAVFTGKKPDRTSLYNTCDIKDGMAVYTFTAQTTAAVGTVECELRLYSGESLITTVRFNLEVYDTVFTSKDAAASQDEQTLLNDLINKVLAILNYLKKGLYFCDLNSTYAEIQAAKAEGKAIYFLSGSKAAPLVLDVGGIFSFAIETADPAASIIYTINEADEWSHKVGEVSDPINPTDAANKRWVEELLASGIEGAKEILVGSGSPEPSTSLQFDPDGEFFRIMGDTAEDPKVLLTQKAIQTLLDNKIDLSKIGQPNGVAALGEDGKVPAEQLPPYPSKTSDLTNDSGFITLDDVPAAPKEVITAVITSEVGRLVCDMTASEIIDAARQGVVKAEYTDDASGETREYYYFKQTKDRRAVFNFSGYIEDGETKQSLIFVDSKGNVTVSKKNPDAVVCYAICNAEAAPLETKPVTWYVPKTMPRPSSNIGTMVDVFWRNGRVNGLGYDITLVWGEEGGADNETIVGTSSVTDSLTGSHSIPAEGTVRYQLEESGGRKRWRYVSGPLISTSYSTDTAADVADKVVPGLSISYLPGMEIYVQLDHGNTAETMRLVPDEGETLPVYGNGTGAKSGVYPAGYILHLKNAGDHWQVVNTNAVMDDMVISNQKTQSSLKLYDTLCLPFEEKGAVVTCHPVENYPLHVVSEIAVKQERPGEQGTPEKPNPILMQDSVSLTQEAGDAVKTYTAQLSEPVAIGQEDWLNGEVQKTGHFLSPGEIKVYEEHYYGDYHRFDASVKAYKEEKLLACSHLPIKVDWISQENHIFKRSPGDGVLILMINRNLLQTDNIAGLKKWLADNKVQILLEGDKTVTSTISAKPTALPGANTLYSDTGDTTVTSRQDPIYTAENLISRVTALENNAVKEI